VLKNPSTEEFQAVGSSPSLTEQIESREDEGSRSEKRKTKEM